MVQVYLPPDYRIYRGKVRPAKGFFLWALVSKGFAYSPSLSFPVRKFLTAYRLKKNF